MDENDFDNQEGHIINKDQLNLTKHLKEIIAFPPIYTGGSFVMYKDEEHAFALYDGKITVFNITTSQTVSTISHVSINTPSPNQPI